MSQATRHTLLDAPLLREPDADSLQRQLHQRIRQAILAGQLLPGSRLPGSRGVKTWHKDLEAPLKRVGARIDAALQVRSQPQFLSQQNT